jgi:hypothetical protein
MGFDITGLGSIFNVVNSVIDKIFPDKTQAEQAKLKVLEMQQAGEFKQIEADLEREKIAMQDVASARARESDMAKAGQRDYTPTILALSLTVGFFGLLAMLIYTDVDQEAMTLLEVMLGSLSTSFIAVIGYYFGSSSSSRKKDDIIANLKAK